MNNITHIPETVSVEYNSNQGVVFNYVFGAEMTSRGTSPENVGQVFFLGHNRPVPDTMWASESALKDWDSPKEDAAWAGL